MKRNAHMLHTQRYTCTAVLNTCFSLTLNIQFASKFSLLTFKYLPYPKTSHFSQPSQLFNFFQKFVAVLVFELKVVHLEGKHIPKREPRPFFFSYLSEKALLPTPPACLELIGVSLTFFLWHSGLRDPPNLYLPKSVQHFFFFGGIGAWT
jgi:hypothetical protein